MKNIHPATEITATKRLTFISDCHLSRDSEPLNEAFLAFVDSLQSDQLYIMGDLFDIWIGDDCLELPEFDFALNIIDALHLKSGKTQIYFQRGNRDFMISSKFEKLSGIKILPELFQLNLNDHKILLSHGDLFCTQDKNYQKLRALLQNPFTIWVLKKLSPNQRLKLAKNIRSKSSPNMSPTYDAHTLPKGFDLIIHGHTHRPAILPSLSTTRCVLSDWRTSTNPPKVEFYFADIINGELNFLKAIYSKSNFYFETCTTTKLKTQGL